MELSLKPGKKLSVLIVEDEEDVRDTIKMFLEMMELFTSIVEASNGSEASMKTAKQDFDLIITDLLMPKMKGMEFVKVLRTQESERNVPEPASVIILSANLTSDEVKVAIQSGIKYVLAKPCTADDFTMKVNEVLLKHHNDKIVKA